MFSGERGKSTSRGQFIPRIAAASCTGCSGSCHPSDAWSWLEPSLLKVTVLAQVLRLRIGCCIAMQSVSKTVSADSLTSVFLQVFPSEDFSCAFSGQSKDLGNFLRLHRCSLPCCALSSRLRSLSSWTEKVLFPGYLRLSISSVRRQQDISAKIPAMLLMLFV